MGLTSWKRNHEKPSFGNVVVGFISIAFAIIIARVVIINFTGHITLLGIIIILAVLLVMILPLFVAGIYLIYEYFASKKEHKEANRRS